MRFDKLTTKLQQAIADAQSLAVKHDNQYIEPAHVLSALLADADSGAASLLARAGAAVKRLAAGVDTLIAGLPRVQGAEGNIQVSRDLQADRKSAGWGKQGSVSVELGGRRIR